MKSLLPALILILAAASFATFYIADIERDDTAAAAPRSSPLDEGYDYYVQGMRATRFGSDGQAVSQLRAERVTHYPDGDRAELNQPAFDSFGSVNEVWQVSATTGTLMPDIERGEDRLELAGDVNLRKPLESGDFINIRTTALTVFTTSEEVTTEAPFNVQMRNSRFNGVGMNARLADNYIQLKDVNGTHDPVSTP